MHPKLCKSTFRNIMENKTTGIAVPIEAKPLPVSLPALRPILARAMMPRIMANIAATITIMGHTKLLNPGTRKTGNTKRVRMPNMSGFELANAIRKKNPEQKVILMTGYADEAEVLEQQKNHGFPFFTKPADLQTMISKIVEDVLAGKYKPE